MSTADGRKRLRDALKQYPSHVVEGVIETLKTPGKVANGEIDLNTGEGLDRAVGLATLLGPRFNKLPTTGKTGGFGPGAPSDRPPSTKAPLEISAVPAAAEEVGARPPPLSDTAVKHSQENKGAKAPNLREFISEQRGLSLNDLYPRAVILHNELAAADPGIASKTGAKFFKAKGPKEFDAAAEKIGRKKYPDPSLLTDIARHTFIIETPAQANAVARDLARHYSVLDEGWKMNEKGYLDRKVLVRAADGTVGEIQLMSPSMYAAKHGGGHDLYKRSREMPEGVHRDSLTAKETSLYESALREMGAQWKDTIQEFRRPDKELE